MEPAVVAAAHAKVEADPRGAPETMPAVEPAPVLVVADEASHIPDATMAAIFHARPCALDDAPVGSKIVVSKDTEGVKCVNLTTPSGPMRLPTTDLAYTLPVGAKIRRVMPSVFQATELNPAVVYPPMTTSTGREAIDAYRDHFHKD